MCFNLEDKIMNTVLMGNVTGTSACSSKSDDTLMDKFIDELKELSDNKEVKFSNNQTVSNTPEGHIRLIEQQLKQLKNNINKLEHLENIFSFYDASLNIQNKETILNFVKEKIEALVESTSNKIKYFDQNIFASNDKALTLEQKKGLFITNIQPWHKELQTKLLTQTPLAITNISTENVVTSGEAPLAKRLQQLPNDLRKLPSGGNNCFANSAIQFILNNQSLVDACKNHEDSDFATFFTQFINSDMSNSDGISKYKDLINHIRANYLPTTTLSTSRGRTDNSFSQESASLLLANLFNNDKNINYISVVVKDDLILNRYNVFQKLKSYTNDQDLIQIVNGFPKIKADDTTMERCEAFEQLKQFVINSTSELNEPFGALFQNKNHLEFLTDISQKDDTKLLLLKNLIQHKAFKNAINQNNFTWVDTSGYGVNYSSASTKGDPLFFKDIPNNQNLNAIIVHSGDILGNAGHYVCWVKKNNNWFYCNDNHIYESDIKNLDLSISNNQMTISAYCYNYK